MRVAADLYYTKEHEWVRIDDEKATVGISDHAQEQLGDITYVDLPAAGKRVEHSGTLATIESVKAASDIYAPVGGTVAEANSTLGDHPELVNKDPYGAGWICTLAGVDKADTAKLMTAAQYEQFLKEQ